MFFKFQIFFFSIIIQLIKSTETESFRQIVELIDKEKIPKNKLEIFEMIALYANGSKKFDLVHGDTAYILWREPTESEVLLINEIISNELPYKYLLKYTIEQFTHPKKSSIYVELELWDEDELNEYTMCPRIDKMSFKDPFASLKSQ
ncbi:hypothetical protein RF11_12908 [Thelohanellus kitauei]|uniref:Uncharacterized protein n=1 Tax=Thelohanellus kitauei TaxID=669202 RepID=A0A0C2IX77_THEKT|nr:hypothetical protein RF11_12908 [Thelohanellus kitauei]